MRSLLLVLFMFLLPGAARADFAASLDKLMGYTIIDNKAIRSWHDDKDKVEGSFAGCKPGRVVTFSDGKTLTCAGYGVQPTVTRPTATLLSKPIPSLSKTDYDYKMVVGDEIYDMKP